MITIYKYDGTVRAEVEPSADSYVNLQISDEHYADINFVSSAWIPFEVGDYVFLFGQYYQLLKVAAPITKKSSVSFEYKLKFEDERQDMDDVNLMLFDNTTSDITPAYDPLHSYSKGDVVAYHTLYWECISDTAIQGITPIEGNYWQLRSSVTHTVAEYDPTKTYTYGEEAIYNYCIFKHIGSVDTVGVHPEEGANWTQLTTAPQFDFSSVLTPRRWAQLFCDNMMRARPDQTWTVGYCIPDQPKEQAFSNVSVLSALASTADLYETEFYIEETAHRVFTINIGKKAITTSLTMKYGGDDAFSDIERNEVTDNKKVTRLVAMGGTKNILPTYRGGSKRLLLPDKMYLDSANIDPNHPLEGTHTWEDIYPSMMHATDDWDSTVPYAVGDMVVYNNSSWTCLVSNTNQTPSEGTYWQISEGTVTEFISEYKLIDKNLTFNPLDPTLIMSDGTIPKIHFITGNLAGYEFPIADFNKETKQITIQSIQDGNDSILPTAGYTFKAGDQFNIVDFYMPQSYITKAENYLAAKATEWLQRYSVDQITYKGSVNRVWSAQNQIEIVEGDLIQVVDTDFGINIQYRITQVKRYIRENYRYEIVLDNTPYVPSKIQSIINSTEKSSTYLQYSNLDTQMAKTRTYKGASEAIDMAFDPESKYFTSGIAPLFVKTAMALFGTETQQYTLTGIKVSTSEGTPNIVSWGTGTITDTTQQSSARTWNIPSGSFTATDNDTSYYAYIRCNTESGSTVAEMIFTEKQYKLNEDSAYYYFLLGSLTKLTGSIRQFFTSSGFTFISGDSIVTGIIRSADGNTYFDLTNSHLHIGNSDKYIDYQNGVLKQKGIINVSQSGVESVIGVFRGAYQPNTMYYEGDTVTYGGSTWRYINTTAAQNVTPVEGSNWTNVSAAGKGISSTVITYQVSDSGTTIPTGDWLSSIPSVSAGNYLWTRTVITYTDSTDSTSYSVAMAGATGATGKGISSTAITYQESGSGTTAPTGTWLTSIPSVPAGSYLWTRTVITYTDGQTSTGYTVSYQSTNGVNSYFHTAYSTAADGSTGFSTTDPTGKTYIGTYSDSNEADSTDPTKYTWVLIKGETGATGATGNGISSYSVTYQKSASGTDIPTGSWTTSIPSLAAGEYLWTKTTLVFADSASTSAYSVSMKGETGSTGKGISTTAITYQESDNGTTAPTGSWLTSPPSVSAGNYLWTRTVITYTDSTTSTGYSVGKMGNDGATGATGKGISSTAIGYQLSTSGTTAPTGTWLSSIPSVPAGQYLWTRTVITYTDSTTSTSYTVGMMGETGTTGADGTDGTNGVGIASTSVTYQASSSGTVAPTGTWSTSIPSVSASQYLWTKTVWTYTDSTTATGYSVGMMGATGATGQTGATGNYFEHRYAVNGSNTEAPSIVNTDTIPSGWTTTLPSMNLYQYMWITTAEKTSAGTLVGTWSEPQRFSGAKGDTGNVGPSLTYNGPWNASGIYVGSSNIVSVVQYNSIYYIARYDVGGSFSSATTPGNDPTHWNSFGASFSSIATGLLLAQEAYIENLYVSKLATSLNPYRFLLSILDSSLGVFRNKADSSNIAKSLIGLGKDVSLMQSSHARKPALKVEDVQWMGAFDINKIYYKDDRVYYTDGYTYIFTHNWGDTETPSAGHIPTNYDYWQEIELYNAGGGTYSEVSCDGIFTNGMGVSAISSISGIGSNMCNAALLGNRNNDTNGVSAAVYGVDLTSDSDTINQSKSYGGVFNRLFIESEIDNIKVVNSNAAINLSKSSDHTIHYTGSSDINITLPVVNYRDVGLKFYFRKIGTGIINIHADNGHRIIKADNTNEAAVLVLDGNRMVIVWDGAYWVSNYMN